MKNNKNEVINIAKKIFHDIEEFYEYIDYTNVYIFNSIDQPELFRSFKNVPDLWKVMVSVPSSQYTGQMGPLILYLYDSDLRPYGLMDGANWNYLTVLEIDKKTGKYIMPGIPKYSGTKNK